MDGGNSKHRYLCFFCLVEYPSPSRHKHCSQLLRRREWFYLTFLTFYSFFLTQAFTRSSLGSVETCHQYPQVNIGGQRCHLNVIYPGVVHEVVHAVWRCAVHAVCMCLVKWMVVSVRHCKRHVDKKNVILFAKQLHKEHHTRPLFYQFCFCVPFRLCSSNQVRAF